MYQNRFQARNSLGTTANLEPAYENVDGRNLSIHTPGTNILSDAKGASWTAGESRMSRRLGVRSGKIGGPACRVGRVIKFEIVCEFTAVDRAYRNIGIVS